jgi:DNA-binding LacI/PurR family transcriptional regulator
MKMSEIAKIAGVSTATVSRTFHSPHMVRPEIRNHVLKIAREKGYLYNATAGELSRRRTNIIGVVIPTANKSVFAETLMGIQEKVQENSYSIIIGNTFYDKEMEIRLLTQFRERRVAGVILTGFVIGQESLIRKLIENRIHCVVIWEKLEETNISYVGFDNYAAASSATEYLISLGHRRIGLIIGPYEKLGRVKKRYEGYKNVLKSHGIDFDAKLVFATAEPHLLEGKQAMGHLLNIPNPPTAIFAASDRLAIGAMTAARQAGLTVPEDVSVVGFDDIEFAAYYDPPLTTIRVPAREIGHLAVKVLLENIDNDTNEVKQYLLDSDLIIRKSCSTPKNIQPL